MNTVTWYQIHPLPALISHQTLNPVCLVTRPPDKSSLASIQDPMCCWKAFLSPFHTLLALDQEVVVMCFLVFACKNKNGAILIKFAPYVHGIVCKNKPFHQGGQGTKGSVLNHVSGKNKRSFHQSRKYLFFHDRNPAQSFIFGKHFE